MPVEVEYEYAWVTIDTKAQTMSVYHASVLIEQYNYPLPSSAIELSKIDL